MLVLLDSSNEINAMYSIFAKKFDFVMQITNVGTQKIDSTIFEIYKIVIVVFLITNQANKVRFFKKIFLIINISPDEVFGMLFLTLSDADINFSKREL